MAYVIESRGKAHRFETLELASAAASRIFERTGIVVGIEREHRTKVTKRYGVNGGNRFARVECSCGALTDVQTRNAYDGGEETRAAVIKAEAERVLIHR